MVTDLLAVYLAIEDHRSHTRWSRIVSTTAYAIAVRLVVLLASTVVVSTVRTVIGSSMAA